MFANIADEDLRQIQIALITKERIPAIGHSFVTFVAPLLLNLVLSKRILLRIPAKLIITAKLAASLSDD